MRNKIRDGWSTGYGKWLTLVTVFEVACAILFAATGMWSAVITAVTVGVLTVALFSMEAEAVQYRREISGRNHLLAEEGVRVVSVERSDDGGATITATRRMTAMVDRK